MKKMRFEMLGEVHVQDMTFHNMLELLEQCYVLEIANEPTRSEQFGEWIEEGMAFFWVEGDKIPADGYCMQWTIEEVLQIETSDDFENEEYEAFNYYYDAQQMQFMA